jgi:hypothetical protein
MRIGATGHNGHGTHWTADVVVAGPHTLYHITSAHRNGKNHGF